MTENPKIDFALKRMKGENKIAFLIDGKEAGYLEFVPEVEPITKEERNLAKNYFGKLLERVYGVKVK